MRPVNLLPAEHRPRAATGARQGSAYVVVGVLAVLLGIAAFYVYTLNGITKSRDETARLQAETIRLEARAAALGAFEGFARMKQTRVTSVRQLAERRFDWERLVRELARLLPHGVWLTDFDASAGGAAPGTGPSASGAPGAAPASSGSGAAPGSSSGSGGAPAGASGSGSPTLKIIGCARTHIQVADTLVRLRRLHRAEEVSLVKSERPDQGSSGGTGTGGSTGAGGASAGGAGASAGGGAVSGCGSRGGRANLQFEVQVRFAPPAAAGGRGGAPRRVPTSLGGGS